MLFLAAFTFFTSAWAAFDYGPDNHFACGEEFIDMSDFMVAEKHFTQNRIEGKMSDSRPATIPVYFHVIHQGDGIENGNVPDDIIQKQMQVMNDAYKSTGFSFDLKMTTRTNNAEWFLQAGPETNFQSDMKSQLYQGDSMTLNLYTVSFMNYAKEPGLLGYATFPGSPAPDDGVVIKFTSLPGVKTDSAFNLGITAVHEVGHWFGLRHTFMGGCSEPGDFVDDTPAAAKSTSGCPTDQNTCPDRPGKDPINNYMDYSDDSCLSEFSPGQIQRMKDQAMTYRMVPLDTVQGPDQMMSNGDEAALAPAANLFYHPKYYNYNGVNGVRTGIIVAATLGGFFFLLIVGALAYFFYRRSKRTRTLKAQSAFFVDNGAYRPLNEPAPQGAAEMKPL